MKRRSLHEHCPSEHQRDDHADPGRNASKPADSLLEWGRRRLGDGCQAGDSAHLGRRPDRGYQDAGLSPGDCRPCEHHRRSFRQRRREGNRRGALLDGTDSPVNGASSAETPSPDTSRPSAGTRPPSRTTRRSPWTTSSAGITRSIPARTTEASSGTDSRKAIIARSAPSSSKKPSAPFRRTMPR